MMASCAHTVIATLALAMTIHASVDETPVYTAALATYVEDKLIDDAGLQRIIAACERNEIANPFTRDEAELHTAKWHAYETLQEWIAADLIDVVQVCRWAKGSRSAEAQKKRERSDAHHATTLPWETTTHHRIALGSHFTCALTDAREPECWGKRHAGGLDKENMPANHGSLIAIAGRHSTGCALRADGTVFCWGHKFLFTDEAIELGPALSISVGNDSHACSVKVGNLVSCIGVDNKNQTTIPEHIKNLKVVAVEAGHGMTCVITFNGSLKCWGFESENGLRPPKNLGVVRSVSLGHKSGCAVLHDQSLQCWGDLPTPDWSKQKLVRSVSVGFNTACAVLEDGMVLCFGSSYACGKECSPPQDLGKVREVQTGWYHACAVLQNNTMRCWGETTHHKETTVDENLRVYDGSQS